MNKLLCLLLTVCILTAGSLVKAEPDKPLKILTPSTIVTDGGSTAKLPPGYFLSVPLWEGLDIRMKELQDSETRLKAENEVLRDGLNPTWGTVIAIMSAAAVGAGLVWVVK